MTGRRGLTSEGVIDAAVALVDVEGASALSLSRLAREVGVKPPSLYNHVGGLDSLRRDVGLRVAARLGERLGRAVMGRAGSDAVHAIAVEFRAYVTSHPHLYEFSIQARPDDEEYERVTVEAIEPVIVVLRGYGLDETETIHAARALRSALHGFVSLEIAGGFGFDVDIDQSFKRLIDRLVDSFESPLSAESAGGLGI
ncbi:MAG: TetR/AcrR family transcriptional regulator [Acidimicrobiales bacterium]